MCLALAGRVASLKDQKGTVLIDQVERSVSFVALPQARVGDYVLVSLGMAVEVITPEEAEQIKSAWSELANVMPANPRGAADK